MFRDCRDAPRCGRKGQPYGRVAKNQRVDGDKASAAAIHLVVNAVKGDPKHSDDRKLYEAMGYVRRSERKSGLKRPRKATVISVAA